MVSVASDIVKVFNYDDQEIKVYGTFQKPLFSAEDIGKALRLGDFIRIINGMGLEHGKHIVVSGDVFITPKGIYKFVTKYNDNCFGKFDEMIEQVVEELRMSQIENEKQRIESEYQKKIQSLQHNTKTYQEVDKNQHVYIMKMDGGTKVGKTKDIASRVRSLQTANKNEIQLLYDCLTSDADILERLVHNLLDQYRCSNREFFDCDVNYMKLVISVCGHVIDTIKSTYPSISKEEFLDKLSKHQIVINVVEEKIISTVIDGVQQKELEFEKWLDKHIEKRNNSVLYLKEVCKLYTGMDDIAPRISNKYRIDIENHFKKKYKLTLSYKDSYFRGLRYRGWVGFYLKRDSNS